MPNLIPHFASIAADYDVLLCDVWGVAHNGVAAFPKACDALMRARAGGATVVFITNAPRPSPVVVLQLDGLHVPREAYDAIVTSGDVTRGVIETRAGQSLYHLGPARDRSIFTDMTTPVRFAPVDSADYVVCSGLDDDDVNKPEDYRRELEIMQARKLFMLCANPDMVVDRGDRLVYCAGAVADLYVSMGGEVLYAGKPFKPIYEMALARAEQARGRKVPLDRVLCIGDSVRTDLRGARDAGFDFLFVTAGIHAEELGGRDGPDPEAIRTVLGAAGALPKAVMRDLVW
ncbi:MAG: TIGR01459 family HAD-type hydrolase [Pseudolabrys sp.]|nr:TIGR01459 family HAD-type hydrolase [Pseudolabrys sp.]